MDFLDALNALLRIKGFHSLAKVEPNLIGPIKTHFRINDAVPLAR